jgi:hypothetical protein
MDFEPPAHRSAAEVEALERLAGEVVAVLRRAGLPVTRPAVPVAPGVVGAVVTIDTGDDAAGGVYVAWQEHPGAAAAAREAFEAQDSTSAAMAFSGAVAAAMAGAVIAILRAAGLSAGEAGDLAPFQVRVVP